MNIQTQNLIIFISCFQSYLLHACYLFFFPSFISIMPLSCHQFMAKNPLLTTYVCAYATAHTHVCVSATVSQVQILCSPLCWLGDTVTSESVRGFGLRPHHYSKPFGIRVSLPLHLTSCEWRAKPTFQVKQCECVCYNMSHNLFVSFMSSMIDFFVLPASNSTGPVPIC